jgi:hypothetical protein
MPGDDRYKLSHNRSVVGKKQNMSFSFDPSTMTCYSCSGRGGHSVNGGEENKRQCFILSDQNFPAVLPCSNGECVKILRIEDGSVAELINCWLTITRGHNIPAGSVVVVFSATHLLMEGLGGYVEDTVKGLNKLDAIFRGGIIAIPGIPVLLGGCKSSELLRDIWDMMGWLKQIGKLELKKAWSEVVTRLIGKGGGLVFSPIGGPEPDFRKTCVLLQPAHG